MICAIPKKFLENVQNALYGNWLAVLRIRDVYPGSRIRHFSIADPGSRIRTVSIPDPHQRI
jgi:hypothetical protein